MTIDWYRVGPMRWPGLRRRRSKVGDMYPKDNATRSPTRAARYQSTPRTDDLYDLYDLYDLFPLHDLDPSG